MGFAVPAEAYVRAEDTARQTYAMVDELAQVRAVRSGLPRLHCSPCSRAEGAPAARTLGETADSQCGGESVTIVVRGGLSIRLLMDSCVFYHCNFYIGSKSHCGSGNTRLNPPLS